MKHNVLRIVVAALLAVVFWPPAGEAKDFTRETIYQIVTDRFFNGDATIDNPAKSPGMADTGMSNWSRYWGGDFAGIKQKLDYLKELGVTAIWISPPMDNRDVLVGGGAPYHGYAQRDLKVPEEHFGNWEAFDSMVNAAHSRGIKIIVDFVPNHTSDKDTGEKGAWYDSGIFLADINNDTDGYFHHNGEVNDWNNRYEIQYYNIFSLADIDQENTESDSQLKSAAALLAKHGVDGFRIDAVKHATWGWQYSMVNSMHVDTETFVFGEWFQGTTGDALYWDSHKFANKSGMSLLDYPLWTEMRDVFVLNHNFQELEDVIVAENGDFVWKNALVTFIDNHDKKRFLSEKNDSNLLHSNLVFQMNCRGVPVIYYGTEQYLHVDTNGGSDPYNRPMMQSWDTGTTAFTIIKKLSALRRANNAVAYGGHRQRWINSDVYIYERQFYEDVVLTAINKSPSTSYNITGLLTSLPAGTYSDYLGGLLSGNSITVTGGAVTEFALGPNEVGVWQYSTWTTDTPQVGSIWPTVGHPGVKVHIVGEGFDTSGEILFGSDTARIISWKDSEVTFVVPNIANGVNQAQVKDAAGKTSNKIQFTVLEDTLIPVTFTVNNASPTNIGDYIFLTGSTVELGKWSTSRDTSVGPMLPPNYPNWFINMSMPAGATIEFKFIKIESNNNVTWEAGSNHTYTVPTRGTGFVNVNWQY